MKRWTAIILTIALAAALLAGCGQQANVTPAETVTPTAAPAPTAAPTVTPEPTEEPAAQTTGDAQLDEAVALGIIDYETALRADELATEAEIIPMLQTVHRAIYGKESTFLNAMVRAADPNRAACRYWFAEAMFYSYCEEYYGEPCTDWWTYMESMNPREHDAVFQAVDAANIGVLHYSPLFGIDEDRDGVIGGGDFYTLVLDADEIPGWSPNIPEGRIFGREFGYDLLVNLAFKRYDRVTGEKVMDTDENQLWRPAEKMTIGDAAKTALRHYHSFEDPAVKVAYADVGTYDKSIITDELLNKPTTLPANSCAHLPAEWHGVLFSKMEWVSIGATSFEPDRIIRAEDIQIIKDAGLNFARLNLSFSYLQAPNVESGMVNETRLKLLDNVLALCMENDIHLDIACNQWQDFGEFDDFFEVFETIGQGFHTDKEIEDFAAFWGAIARRYADIPNEYLSFNLFNEAHVFSDAQYEHDFGPAVEAIRAESPDRTIIADIHQMTITGESMAKLGVALSYHLYDPMGFSYINNLADWQQIDPTFLHSVTWPYTENGVTYDAERLLDTPLHYATNAVSINSLRELGERYGVGVMVGELGIFGEYRNGFSPYRYSDETFYGYFADMLSTFEKEGIGWSLGVFNGTWGFVQPCPAVEGVEYEKVGYYYVDTKMQEFFRSWAD